MELRTGMLKLVAQFKVRLGLVAAWTALIFSAGIAEAQPLSSGSLSTRAPQELPGDSYLRWKMTLSGRSYESERERARLSVLGANLDSQWVYTDYMKMQVDLGIALGAGRAQLLYQDFLPSNNFRLRRANVVLHTPGEELLFHAGVLGCPYEAPQLRSCVAFPGISQEIRMGVEAFQVTAGAQQAMPTSETKFNEATELEPVPMYTTEYLDVRVRPHRDLLVQATAAHYKFKDLPRIVAFRSYLSGNLEVAGGGSENSFFTSDFDGYIGSGKVAWNTGSLGEVELGQQWIYNTSAPTAQNMGQLFWGKNTLRTRRHEFIPEFVYFVTESDVSPAIYASSIYGRNNRQGYHLGMSVRFLNEGFLLKAFYTRANKILNSPTQSDQQVFSLALETDYERIL